MMYSGGLVHKKLSCHWQTSQHTCAIYKGVADP